MVWLFRSIGKGELASPDEDKPQYVGEISKRISIKLVVLWPLAAKQYHGAPPSVLCQITK